MRLLPNRYRKRFQAASQCGTLGGVVTTHYDGEGAVMRRSKAISLGAVLAGTALVASACGGGDSGDGGGDGGGGGGSVEIVGAISGTNAEALQAQIEALAEETGIDVTFTTIPDFDTVIQTRVQGNNAPDIAIFPQPGVLLDLKDDMVALDDLIDLPTATTDIIPGLESVAVDDEGKTYGLPISINVKSPVWYPVPEFDDAGYAIPANNDELLALTDQIKADGTPPWCFGFEAGAATGWYVTDWIEQYVLVIGGPEFYDQWTSHEVPFNDPIVKQAAEAFEELILTPGNAVLTPSGMAATPWADALQPLVTDPPGCFMARQGTFVIGQWPPEVQADPTAFVSSFLFPPYPGGFEGTAVLGGGDLAAAFTDSEDVATVLQAMFSPSWGEVWAGEPNSEFLSAYSTFDASTYQSEAIGGLAAPVAGADAFRFDGSDLMPGQVGSGSFWTEMTAWVTGQTDLDTALQNIDDTWPTS